MKRASRGMLHCYRRDLTTRDDWCCPRIGREVQVKVSDPARCQRLGPLRDQEDPPTPNDEPFGAPLALERRDQIRAKGSAQILGNHREKTAERARLCELD